METEKNNYVPSRYNFVFGENGTRFIFNTRLGSYLKINMPIKEDFKWDDLPAELREPFVTGGFVIEKNTDELGLLQMQNRIARFDTTSLGLTLVMTMNCNLRCVYCYEENRPQHMSKKVAEQIMKFVEQRVKNGTKSVGVTFYGGEPMLQYRLICKISEKIRRICKKGNATYQPSIVSNGTLFSIEKAKKLKKLGFKNVQFTLDGTEDVHDKRRPYRDGRGTFKKILKNIEDISSLINVNIRCNVDRSNIQDVKRLVDFLVGRGIHKVSSIYFAPVHELGKGCRDKELDCGSIFSLEEFATIENDLMSYTVGKGFHVDRMPSPTFCPCTAAKVDGLVVEPNGDIQKCWEVVGCEAEKIGTVFDGVKYTENTLKWMKQDPFTDENCRSCKILPLCMGWCPYRLMRDKTPDACIMLKHNIISVLERIYKYRQCQPAASIARKNVKGANAARSSGLEAGAGR